MEPSTRAAPRRRWIAAGVAAGVLAGAVAVVTVLMFTLVPVTAWGKHQSGWTHDHSTAGVPARPSGYSALVQTFGQPCNASANAARSYWPSQSARNVGGYVNYHTYIARNVGYNVRNHVEADHRNGAVDYGVYGYHCRYIAGTTSWSTHAFGAAIDTNSARNPLGQSYWNGRGADGVDYGRYLPNIWRGDYPGHRFYWGLNWTRPDPMHFQYVTNY